MAVVLVLAGSDETFSLFWKRVMKGEKHRSIAVECENRPETRLTGDFLD